MITYHHISLFFFFNDTATTEIYTLSLHDALPICSGPNVPRAHRARGRGYPPPAQPGDRGSCVSCPAASSLPDRKDRKSTRLNSSHGYISYAVFCLKKKKKNNKKELVEVDGAYSAH